MSKTSYPRIPVGNGKFCYSGPNCRKHGGAVKQSQETSDAKTLTFAEHVDKGLKAKTAVFENFVHNGETTRNIQHLSDLGEQALLTGYAARKCEQHGTYHLYPAEQAMKVSQDAGGHLFRDVADAYKEGRISAEEANVMRGKIKQNQDVDIKETYRDDRKTLRLMQIDYSHQEEAAGALQVREEAAEVARRLAFKSVKEPVDYSPAKIDEAAVSDEMVLEYWQCGRKTQYDTVEVGQKTIDSQKETATMSVYQCGHCPKYHIGHGFGRDSVESQLPRAREHWMKFPEKSNMFAFAKGLI